MTQAVVFDVDDTLYLERDYVRSGFRAVGSYLEQTTELLGFAATAWELFLDGRRGTIFDEALRRCAGRTTHGVSVATLVDVYRAHTPSISMLPDADRTVASLLARGIPLAVITDGPSRSQRAKIAALGLEEIAFAVVTDDLGRGRGKPDPAAFLLVQERFDLEGSALIYVADNPHKDFIAPARLGWRTLRVRRPEGLHVESLSGPDVDRERSRLLEQDLLIQS